MNRNYFCNDCNRSTQNPRLYLQHRREHHGESISIYECDLCIYATKHSTKLLRHRRTVHRGILAANRLGPDSPQSFAVIPSQQKHQLNSDDVRVLNCTLCEFSCVNKVLLIDHFRTAHPIYPIYQCDQCSYSHFIKEKFARHQRYHSLHRVQCHICEFSTIYRWNLDRHVQHHSDEANNGFRCQKCNFNTATKQSITAHETNHHGHGQRVSEIPMNAAAAAAAAGAASPMEQPFAFIDNSNSNENANQNEITAINEMENDQSVAINNLDPLNFLKLVWEGVWNAAKANTNDPCETMSASIAPISRSPMPSPNIREYFFHCRNCHFRNEINSNDLMKNPNHSTPEIAAIGNNNNSLNENVNIGAGSYRCGYCHQLSNWKHVIERHCRLVHKSESFVERFSAYEQIFHRLTPSVRRSKETLEHEQ